MFHFTYFIISPGAEIGSYVSYRNAQGNYIKFGDSQNAHEDRGGIRGAYLTHNPDIGISAVMGSAVFQNPGLGTRLKNFIIGCGYHTVGTTEWFSIQSNAAWSLSRDMMQWDGRVLTLPDQQQLEALIQGHLGAALLEVSVETTELSDQIKQ